MHNDKKSPNRQPFSEMSLEPVVERGLESMGYDQATPIQSRVIGPMLEGRDVIALAPTGTGKTLGYGIPLAQRMILEPPPMMRRARKRKGGDPGAKYVDPRRRLRGLVVVPTRELASQVASELRSLTKGSLIKVGAVWGKAALKPQRDKIEAGLDFLAGTPGRLRELMDLDVLSLAFVKHLVIDEGDRMLDMGFLPQVRAILERMPEERQMAFFSATMPPAVEDLARSFLEKPARVEVGKHTRAASHLGNKRIEIEDALKVPLVLSLVVDQARRGVIIFARTRRRAGWVAAALRRNGTTVGLVHGDRSQNQRLRTLEQFGKGELAAIVATDVAARGLHIPAVRTVINYDLPVAAEEWVHRVGRAGHGGGFGESFTLITPFETPRWGKIRSITKADAELEPLPDMEKWVRPQDLDRLERVRRAEKTERIEPFRGEKTKSSDKKQDKKQDKKPASRKTSGKPAKSVAKDASDSVSETKPRGGGKKKGKRNGPSRGGKKAAALGHRGGDRIGHGRRNSASNPIAKGQKPGGGGRKPSK